jgi:CelD/BcsL family acetyltransferase involved in cellulose biosynthesis
MFEQELPSVALIDIDDREDLGHAWLDLQQRSRHSFFTSWGWVKCWLECLPQSIHPQALIAENSNGIVGLGLMNHRRRRRRKVVVSNGLFLNETGVDELDALTVEHNGLLADSAIAPDVKRACLEFLLNQVSDWDELVVSGVDADGNLSQCLDSPPAGIRRQVIKEYACYTVNLAALRESRADYLSKLSSNTRQQVRRAMRLCEQAGPLQLVEAASLADANLFYEEMKRLHEVYWHAKGQPGAFANEFCDRFHRQLISDRWPHGEIQLLRVHAGSDLLGYLYNFAYDGRIYSYQSGFRYDDDPKRKPGMICHVLAVQHNVARGAAVYDFLGGDARYKESLSTESTVLRWLVWQRARWRFQVEEALREVKHRLGFLNHSTNSRSANVAAERPVPAGIPAVSTKD